MSVEESIKLFEEKFPKLTVEENELTGKVAEIFIKRLDEIKPIIEKMKSHRYYFMHPDLSDNLKTTHGVILGRNIHNNAEVYVYTGSGAYLTQVNARNDEIMKQGAILIEQFFKVCDLDFAISGIYYVLNFLEKAIETLEEKNNKKKQFIERYGYQ